MYVVNRTVAIITAKQPFADWLMSLPDRGEIDWTESSLQAPHVVLLPEETLDTEEETAEVISQYWYQMATSVFAEWVLEPDLWPKDFAPQQFFDWFQVELIDSAVTDLVQDPLERESQ